VDDYADRQAKFRRDRQPAALIGETRTAVLRSSEVVCNTTELARRAGTSTASASTRRRGASVLHSLTPVGIALLARHIEPNLCSGPGGTLRRNPHHATGNVIEQGVITWTTTN
jgi:hypothetical protein